ncbi:MAG: hypothetical protein R2780_13370 [Crocinitomicaceae bacterium]|nr:hypothetical protein [Crocinitomicaceae bacterium]
MRTVPVKKLIYFLPIIALTSCGGSSDTENTDNEETAVYEQDHEWIVNANKLKDKLGDIQASFVEIGNKEVEETVCNDMSRVPYSGNKEVMNVWMMSTYMLDNFAKEEFGKHDFQMPDVAMKNGTPLRDLDWVNFNSTDFRMFSAYRLYPELKDIPKKYKDEDGVSVSNEEIVQNLDMTYKALEDGLFAVVAITDYLKPQYVSKTEYETGYFMGYLMFADWETGQLSCISPLLAQNSETIDFSYTSDGLMDDEYSNAISAMNADLQFQTGKVVDSLARLRTGFEGEIWVNYSLNLDNYKE